MLLEFTTKNFRSLRDGCKLSMVASSDKTLAQTNLLQTGIKGLPNAVRVAVIYGANASGKSNVIRAMQVMREITMRSANNQLGQPFLIVQPFKLDPMSAKEPTEFEITFLQNGVRYQYGFSLTAERITGEWLFAYPTAKAQRWFQREYDPTNGKDNYFFGSHLAGQRRVWQEATKPNSLYLSTAVQLNSEQLKGIFEWIANDLVIIPYTRPLLLDDYTVSYICANANKAVKDFLVNADISIDDILINKRGYRRYSRIIENKDGINVLPPVEEDVYVPVFRHMTQSGSATFEFEDESGGTQNLFTLAGPLFDILTNGGVLIVDELERSLHPLLVRQLVALFQNPESNAHGAQLLFTTHETSLLDPELLRRDQIWFTEKNAEQATMLFPLTEFTARKNEAFEAGYLSGRYGAIPLLDIQKGVGSDSGTNP